MVGISGLVAVLLTDIARMVDSESVGQWLAIVIVAAIWIPYIKVSKRVANTFGGHAVVAT
jgi:threonine/homoserine efflux transporter RhtA